MPCGNVTESLCDDESVDLNVNTVTVVLWPVVIVIVIVVICAMCEMHCVVFSLSCRALIAKCDDDADDEDDTHIVRQMAT